MSYTNLISNIGNLIGQSYIEQELLAAGITLIEEPNTKQRSSLYLRKQ